MIVNILDFLLRFAGSYLLFQWVARWFVSRYLDKDHLLTLYAEWLISEVKRCHGITGYVHIKFRDGYNVFVFSPEYRVLRDGDDYQVNLRKEYGSE
ncbi:hypothetical protein AI17_004407 [Salmonella enterica subsp. enterica serovar Oslo]|nr:hypothetical protein [Salmonella enterica]EED8308061.1 hypothetical protein [Salmonella enterica subsp. enterica serovar Minnesota]EEJ6747401.1 hypothetical protein [Salmonella enterica subsp. enterica serovar Oslo]EEJ7180025.1 hypothetical protein [Salmonella enterica subsp. enterica serovar Glostrup]HCM4645513.1 hypothetical protein [Salmonella enterica subsp. enterica serovar Panama]